MTTTWVEDKGLMRNWLIAALLHSEDVLIHFILQSRIAICSKLDYVYPL